MDYIMLADGSLIPEEDEMSMLSLQTDHYRELAARSDDEEIKTALHQAAETIEDMSLKNERHRVEFIESYIKDGDYEYVWNDNHGELIRCKDCKHYSPGKAGWCYRNEIAVDANDYCSFAERRDE